MYTSTQLLAEYFHVYKKVYLISGHRFILQERGQQRRKNHLFPADVADDCEAGSRDRQPETGRRAAVLTSAMW